MNRNNIIYTYAAIYIPYNIILYYKHIILYIHIIICIIIEIISWIQKKISVFRLSISTRFLIFTTVAIRIHVFFFFCFTNGIFYIILYTIFEKNKNNHYTSHLYKNSQFILYYSRVDEIKRLKRNVQYEVGPAIAYT